MTLEVIFCPICGEIIHRQDSSSITYRARIPTKLAHAAPDLLTAMQDAAEDAHQRMIRAAETSCVLHFSGAHPLRYRLWRRFGWNRLVTFRFPRRSRPRLPDDVNVYVFGGFD